MVRLIVTLVIAAILGGAIAYLGNQLGRYIGRKKLSIFRLRPRHTSILITTITGSLIASGTLLFAYLSFWEVRTLFAGLEKFRRDVATETLERVERAQMSSLGQVYEDRDPILTAIIDGSNKIEVITEQLKSVVAYANEATLQKSQEVAELSKSKFRPPPDMKLVGYIPEDLNNLAVFISNGKRKYIVMVFSLQYAFLGEKFAVGFYPIEYIEKVFSQDEEIARGTIDGTNSNEEIHPALSKLLVQARVVALKKGMLENPKDKKVLFMEPKHFLDILDRVSKTKKITTVIVRSKKDVDNRGPLEVYYDLAPGDGSSMNF